MILKRKCLRKITEKKLVSWRRNQNEGPKPRRLHLNSPQKYVVSKPSIQRPPSDGSIYFTSYPRTYNESMNNFSQKLSSLSYSRYIIIEITSACEKTYWCLCRVLCAYTYTIIITCCSSDNSCKTNSDNTIVSI